MTISDIMLSMKLVLLTRGAVAIVDDEDFDRVIKLGSWHLCNGYAAKRQGKGLIYLHQLIAGISPLMVTDHINRDRLDNRRANLRTTTRAINMINSDSLRVSRTGLKGVSFYPKMKHKPWRAVFANRHIGYFSTPEKASEAYQNTANGVQ